MTVTHQWLDVELKPDEAILLEPLLPVHALVLSAQLLRVCVGHCEQGVLLGYKSIDNVNVMPGGESHLTFTEFDFTRPTSELLSPDIGPFELVSVFSLSTDRAMITLMQSVLRNPTVIPGGAAVRIWYTGRTEQAEASPEQHILSEGAQLHG